MNIQELEVEFISNSNAEQIRDFIFKQILKSDKAYVYEVTTQEKDVVYEVFERRLTKRFDFINKIVIEGEYKVSYPKTKDFGDWAWCYNDKELAIKKFKELNG